MNKRSPQSDLLLALLNSCSATVCLIDYLYIDESTAFKNICMKDTVPCSSLAGALPQVMQLRIQESALGCSIDRCIGLADLRS